MRLTVKDPEVVLPLTIAAGFEVDVRAQTRVTIERLFKSCSRPKPNPQSGRMESLVDEDLWQQKAPDAYIAGWRGLTPAILRELGIGAEAVPTAADGTIPYDPELARDVWKLAYADRFSQPILTFGRELLAFIDAEKKTDSSGSPSSSM